MESKSWQLGAPGTLMYRLYDALRCRLNERLGGYLLEKGMGRSGSRVLEAGSGPAFASSILARDSKVELSVAVDIDLEAMQEARRRDPDLAVAVADMCHLPFRDESMDLVWNSSTVEHLPDPSCALVEMGRVTRRGGNVFVGVPNRYGPLGFQRWIPDTGAGIWVGTVFSRPELEKMLRRVGLMPAGAIFYFFRFFVGVLAGKSRI
jgi:SAM-dependent methyltransferase